jgi:Ca-activated chloride channel family protein
MTWRLLTWSLIVAVTCAVSWLWPRIGRPPTDFEIGVDYLNQQQPELALLFFDEPKWHGVAAYRAGRYAQATRDFSRDDTVASLYNLGNSYARLRDWSNAITTYQRVLRFDPEHADAQHNLALVKRMQEQAPGQPVAMAAPPEQLPPEAQEELSSIPQESTPQSTQAREAEQSDTAGNTSDTDEAGETDPDKRSKQEKSTGETGSAGAVGEASEEQDRDSGRIVGSVDLKARNSARAPEALLRRIRDDPRKVLQARLLSAYETRIGGGTE